MDRVCSAAELEPMAASGTRNHPLAGYLSRTLQMVGLACFGRCAVASHTPISRRRAAKQGWDCLTLVVNRMATGAERRTDNELFTTSQAFQHLQRTTTNGVQWSSAGNVAPFESATTNEVCTLTSHLPPLHAVLPIDI
jgi:hypothetical protein